MKTKTENRKMNQVSVILAMIAAMLLLSKSVSGQDQDKVSTLMKPDVKVSELWTPEIKINSIQGKIGTLVGFYGGALIDRTFLIGIAGGVNLGHPTVNYGYFGGIGQFIIEPDKMVHLSGQLLIAYGSTKDYEDPKEGLLDNFWNISGAGFFMMEPGINFELNLSQRVTLVTGVSYRYVSGLDETDEDISYTRVTNEDMSGINFNIGLKFAKRLKK
jgi:hypothetical protein